MAAYASDGSSAWSDRFAALQRNPEWQTLLQSTVQSDHQVEEAFAFLRKTALANGGARSTPDLESPDAMDSLQADAELAELLCSAGAPSTQTKTNIEAAFRLLQARHPPIPTRHHSPPPPSPSHSEHESTEANDEGFSSSSYAVPNCVTTRRGNSRAHSSSGEAIPHNVNEAQDLYDLGMNTTFYNSPYHRPSLPMARWRSR
jgi:hypothetical protein